MYRGSLLGSVYTGGKIVPNTSINAPRNSIVSFYSALFKCSSAVFHSIPTCSTKLLPIAGLNLVSEGVI